MTEIMKEVSAERTDQTGRPPLFIEQHITTEGEFTVDRALSAVDMDIDQEAVDSWANKNLWEFLSVRREVREELNIVGITDPRERQVAKQELTDAKLRERAVYSFLAEKINQSLEVTDSVETFMTVIKPLSRRREEGSPAQIQTLTSNRALSPSSVERLVVHLANRISPQYSARLGQQIGEMLSETGGSSWRHWVRVGMTRRAKQGLKVNNRDEFVDLEQKQENEKHDTENSPENIFYYNYFKAIGYDKISKTSQAKKLYDSLQANGRIVKDENFLQKIIEKLEDEDIYDDFIERNKAEDLMATGVDLFVAAAEQAASYSQNARVISNLFNRQKQEKSFSYTQLIKLSNQLGASLNKGDTLPEGMELPELDERSIGELPIAIARLHYVMTETGRNDMSEDTTAMLNKSMGLAKILTAAGAEKKFEERPMSIGDVVLEFPEKTARELQEIIELLEAGADINNLHEMFRLHNQRTEGRAFWHKFQAGYGIIS